MHPLSIKRALANMVVNAARYGNGWIKVSSGSEGNWPGSVWKMTVRELNRSSVSICSSRSCAAIAPVRLAGPASAAIVQRIIDNHNGKLELGSSERGGLLIRARLPVPMQRALPAIKPAKEI